MKRRLLATVCSAAILANMVPYQAFADNAQATPETAQSITLDSAAQAFAADGQTEAYNYKLKVAVSGVNGGYVKAGDKVKVAVTISDAAWATDANKAGFIAASIELTYDSEVLEPNYDEELGPKFKNLRNPNPNKSDTVSYTISGNIDENAGRLNWVVEAPNPAKIGKDQWRATYADLSENDTVIVTYSFTAKTDIPKGLSKSLGFNLTSKGKDNADSAFGDFVSQSNKLFVKATAEIENNTSLKVDTKAPTITLSDTANNGKFFYAPVGVTVADDGIGLASVTFGGKELTLSADGSYSLTESGTLTATDKLGNTSKLDITIDTTALDAARAAVAKLPDAAPDYNHQALDDATLKKLETANNTLEALNGKRADLVKDLGSMVRAEDVKLTDKADVEKLRSRVKEMQDEDKATFTDAELKNLTAAEKALADLEQRSKNAHKAVAALPGADTVKLTEKADIEALNKEIAALETKGDSFTAAEKQKLADAQKGITDLEKAQADMKATLESLKDDKDVRYDDKAAEEKLSADIEALQDRGVAVDETTMGVNGWKRYTRYAAAVKAMNSELTGLNSKMQTELDSWTYPYDIAKYDALRKDMDAAAKKYGMTKEQTKAEFTNYETDKIQAAAVEEKIKQANAKIKALPATITKAQEQDVVAITAIVNELKAAPYKMTDSALQTALGSNYAIYTKAVATLAELNKPADNNSSGSSNNNNSNSSNTTSTNNKTTTTSTANKITKPAAAATTIPQTSDAFPLTTLITLAVASLGGLIAVLFKKKRND